MPGTNSNSLDDSYWNARYNEYRIQYYNASTTWSNSTTYPDTVEIKEIKIPYDEIEKRILKHIDDSIFGEMKVKERKGVKLKKVLWTAPNYVTDPLDIPF